MDKDRECVFFVKNKCSIYSIRPSVCSKFQCAWSQHLLDEDMRPDKIGLIVVVRNDNNEQYFAVTKLNEKADFISYKRVDDCAKRLNVKWIKTE